VNWGRDPRAGYWIQTWPKATVAALCAAVAVLLMTAYGIYAYRWTPLQRYYLKAYILSEIGAQLNLSPKAYRLLAIGTERNAPLAGNRGVADTRTSDGRLILTVSGDGEAAGVRMLRPREMRLDHRVMHTWLMATVYRGQTLSDFTIAPLVAGGGALVGLLVLAIPADRKRAQDRRQGRRLKGPRLVDVATFNAAYGSRDGLAITLQHGTPLRLPRASERQHMLIMGAIGSGKSALIRQALVQIRERGESAIVYDPHGEYVQQFYQPDSGDIVLNPLDARCPYWVPGDEIQTDAEALAMSQALFVEEPRDQRFFTTAAREIFAFLLLQKRPRAEQLVEWMTYGDTLDEMLKGTPLAAYIHNTAPPQRSAVMATLAGVARTLDTLPREDNGQGCWSADGWAQHRKGWIFLTSTPQTRARLIPLQSLWLDMLILRLMEGSTERPATWFILDEVASLHKLPQLHTAITENRKYNNPMVIGCQGRAQLETRYGHDAETMIAQPATKIFLRTSEPRAAEWASDAIGKVEIERLSESRRDAWGLFGSGDNHQLTLQRSVEPLVMASELAGLPDLHGYLKLGNDVAPLQIQYLTLPNVQPAFVPRSATVLEFPISAAAVQSDQQPTFARTLE
jgi:hypothetical protein